MIRALMLYAELKNIKLGSGILFSGQIVFQNKRVKERQFKTYDPIHISVDNAFSNQSCAIGCKSIAAHVQKFTNGSDAAIRSPGDSIEYPLVLSGEFLPDFLIDIMMLICLLGWSFRNDWTSSVIKRDLGINSYGSRPKSSVKGFPIFSGIWYLPFCVYSGNFYNSLQLRNTFTTLYSSIVILQLFTAFIKPIPLQSVFPSVVIENKGAVNRAG